MNFDNILKIHIKNECTYSFLIYNISSNVSWEDPMAFHLPKKCRTAYKDTSPWKPLMMQSLSSTLGCATA